MTAIRFDHVDVIFGTHTKEALKLLDQGLGVAGGAMFLKGWLAVPQIQWRGDRPAWMR